MSPDLVFWFELALKMTLTATVVVVTSIAVELSGPFIGAMIAALPTAAECRLRHPRHRTSAGFHCGKCGRKRGDRGRSFRLRRGLCGASAAAWTPRQLGRGASRLVHDGGAPSRSDLDAARRACAQCRRLCRHHSAELALSQFGCAKKIFAQGL